MQDKYESKFSKKQKIVIACVFLVPLFASIFAIYIIFGNYLDAISKMWAYKGKPSATASSITSLSYIFTILIAFYTFITTSIFSYLVWKVSKSGLAVSKKLQNLEYQREEEVTRENALIVYYDLQRGISNLQELYTNYELNGIEAKPSKIYFSTDWIKNVANLRDHLTEQELNKVYKLYEQFHALQSLLEKHKSYTNDEELKTQLKILTEEVFAIFIPLGVLKKHYVSSANELVNIDLYVILKKIYSLTFSSSKRVTKKNKTTGLYETTLDGNLFFTGDNEKLFEGNGTLYNTNKEVKCSGEFKEKKFFKGQVYGYYSPGYEFYYVKYSKQLAPDELEHVKVYQPSNDGKNEYYYDGHYKNNKIYDGITTLFNIDHDIIYQGRTKNHFREGEGTSYNHKGEIEYKGIWKEDYIHKGSEYLNNKILFEGEFKIVSDRSSFTGKKAKPWSGITTNYDISFKVKGFTGEIYNGEPIKGHGKILNLDYEGRDLKALEHDEKMAVEHAEYEVENPVEINVLDIEQQLENDAKEHNNRDRKNYGLYNEYIKAEWIDKKAIVKEINERNIKIYDARG
ncbi:hypothetical protein P4388_24770 [Bacillus thuringiensis]|uniref:hypothetical protein n=1 Tax=Bacillus thuringiensis TaxID=1428 RepID=UPI000B66DCD9|nr:hypothetical protein [Bacillus thuringiensis]MED3351797.1 hypothetical protein [Bacillus thuringiensis]OTW87151.1 hypothetical protein BK710_12765 [Bacillus thuringiensis serovar sumiyoshiensis]OTW93181.1 hypothetical protein BK711_25300 [Bacillus thuringiensis serovar fukuokaensis]